MDLNQNLSTHNSLRSGGRHAGQSSAIAWASLPSPAPSLPNSRFLSVYCLPVSTCPVSHLPTSMGIAGKQEGRYRPLGAAVRPLPPSLSFMEQCWGAIFTTLKKGGPNKRNPGLDLDFECGVPSDHRQVGCPGWGGGTRAPRDPSRPRRRAW